ncbi:MAG: protein kinase [Sandaracinaceae bacterium]|nr:protein kinase [Sandaracinaceae bacterium]
MAEVYVAKTKGIGGFEKLIAIKVIHPRFSEDEHFIQMLVEEAKISVHLSHVNVAQTFDLGCIDDTYYIAMEFIEGADAYRVGKRAHDRNVALPVDICTYVAAEICNGLGYAHRKRDSEGRPMGIVHRDISPQNVLISYAGEVKLVDFGIAKAALRGGQTEVGVIKGKYYYMSPEQAWGDPVDQRSDIFSTGILLHELLTGEMVYQENNVPALLDRVRKAEIASPRHKRPDVNPALERVIMKSLAKEPADRYQSAHAFGQDLTELLYKGNPTFTASRLAQLMGALFPDDVRRHSQILKLPEDEPNAPSEPPPSQDVELPPMSRDEFVPPPEASVVFDLGDVDGDESTRNDILPFRRSSSGRTAPIANPPPSPEPPTDRFAEFGGLPAPEDWEEETFLKGRGEWDESTLVDEDGDAFQSAHEAIKALRRPGAPPPPEDLPGESTVATDNPLAFVATRVADSALLRPDADDDVEDRTAFGAPAFPDDDDDDELPDKTAMAAPAFDSNAPPSGGVMDRTANQAPAFKPGAMAFPRPRGAKPASVPPPGRMPPKGRIPPPPRRPPPPPPDDEPSTLDDPVPPGAPHLVGAPMALHPDAPDELPAERTVALSEEGNAVVPMPAARGFPLSGPSSAGIRLGPEADRYFQPPGQQPFDPFGGVSAPSQPEVAVQPLADPFAAPPPRTDMPEENAEQLGKPQPIRFILAAVAVALLVAIVAAVGAWFASRPDPTTLTLITTPEGAEVSLDGDPLPHQTPVTLPDLQPGRVVQLELHRSGHEDRTDSFTLREGENRRVYHLNPIQVTLRITTEPVGAQVWVDGVLRGSSPLEIAGLSIGEELALRGSLLGRDAEQHYTVGEDRAQQVTLTIPTAAP